MSISEGISAMAYSGKAVLERRIRQASSGTKQPISMQLDEAGTQFRAATAKVVKTADETLQAAQQGNRRIHELNRLILAKLDELDGRRPAW